MIRETSVGAVADAPAKAGTGSARHALAPATMVSLGAAIVVGVIFTAVGLASSRIDVALLGMPFVVSAAWTWDRRPRPRAASSVTASPAGQPDGATLGYTVDFTVPTDTVAVRVRLKALGAPRREFVIAATDRPRFVGRLPVLHSGPLTMLRLEYRLIGVDGVFLTEPASALELDTVVSPRVETISSLPLPRQLQSVTGTHESARPGDGGDFRDIHPFAPGDRMRRIDWKRTARRAQTPGELYVRRTAALADATVMIVIDSRDDVGEFVVSWGSNSPDDQGLSSMDLAREAASSLATSYIRAGDRVGFQDLGSQGRMLTPAGGARQLSRLFRVITLSRPSTLPIDRHRPPLIPPGALVYLLSSFLDQEAARTASFWRAGGHRVIGIDVLPTPQLHGLTHGARLAHRIVSMERDDRLDDLAASGVELMRWQQQPGENRRAAALRSLSRRGGGAR